MITKENVVNIKAVSLFFIVFVIILVLLMLFQFGGGSVICKTRTPATVLPTVSNSHIMFSRQTLTLWQLQTNRTICAFVSCSI